MAGLELLKVQDLMIPGGLEWNVELVQDLFSERDVNEILSIPLSSTQNEDHLIWHPSKNSIPLTLS